MASKKSLILMVQDIFEHKLDMLNALKKHSVFTDLYDELIALEDEECCKVVSRIKREE